MIKIKNYGYHMTNHIFVYSKEAFLFLFLLNCKKLEVCSNIWYKDFYNVLPWRWQNSIYCIKSIIATVK